MDRIQSGSVQFGDRAEAGSDLFAFLNCGQAARNHQEGFISNVKAEQSVMKYLEVEFHYC